jgi:hypothetical protein
MIIPDCEAENSESRPHQPRRVSEPYCLTGSSGRLVRSNLLIKFWECDLQLLREGERARRWRPDCTDYSRGRGETLREQGLEITKKKLEGLHAQEVSDVLLVTQGPVRNFDLAS